ncbi:MAG: hypothetical protein ACRD36_02465, partial [Candidatus Acidiferrum sp.]
LSRTDAAVRYPKAKEKMLMSHHCSGPDWGFPFGEARLDLTDLYAFPKPGDRRRGNAHDEVLAEFPYLGRHTTPEHTDLSISRF